MWVFTNSAEIWRLKAESVVTQGQIKGERYNLPKMTLPGSLKILWNLHGHDLPMSKELIT